MNIKALLSSILFIALCFSTQAERYKYGEKNKGGEKPPVVAANCSAPSAATELDINNTKALIQSGGDMWWDFDRPRYEIPKGSNKTSLFAGSLWLAGQDVSGQFKVAALRFRGQGTDFWTGPLSTVDAEITQQTCSDYDRHWETTRTMVAEFSAWFEAGQFDQENGTTTQQELYPGYTIPSVIEEWPAHGRNFEPYNEDYYLAPFYDRDGDGDYNPQDGDYPGYVLNGQSDCSRRVRDIYGDQNLWWVFNDKGNVHTESGGQAIGMEIRAQAFAFATTDEVNNMTFYNYELINRSSFALDETYFGQWVDGDLGNAQDDYVGVDVGRGLGYFYNGDDEDEDAGGNLGYGVNPPAIGVDFFQGPFQANDGKDNCLCVDDYSGAIADDGIVYKGQGAGYGDGIVDNERYGMRKFLYHVNAPTPTGDPSNATDYYNMLRGIWRDGTPMTYGGNGYDPGNPSAIPAGYMFPGDTDPLGWGTNGAPQDPWTEVTAGNTPADRRFVQSSGPFQLGSGAVNNITVGIVWMQANQGGRLESVALMRKADDKTQALFDSCFEILDGPDAPAVTVQELDREIILMLSNPLNSNNFNEEYAVVDPFLAAPDSVDTDADGTKDVKLTPKEKQVYSTYKFEGYQIYQLADGSVGTNDLDDPDKARLVAQVDIANDVTKLVNFEFDSRIGQDVPVVKVDGENEGVRHTFQVERDLFATEDSRLVNHKTYYFMAISYAYNRFGDGFGNLESIDGVYDPASDRIEGQKIPYLASRKAPSGPVRVYEAIPHKTDMESGGVVLNAEYGDGIEITRIEGRGNGGNFVNIKEDNLDSILAPQDWSVDRPLTFEAGEGPVALKVVDPLMVPPGEFTIRFIDTTLNGNSDHYTWLLYQRDSDNPIDTIFADQTVKQRNEQVMFDLGLSLTVGPGYASDREEAVNNGYIGFEISYDDETDPWFSGFSDADATQRSNWIKSGTYAPEQQDGVGPDQFDVFNYPSNTVAIDPDEEWESVADGTWAPFALSSYDTNHPVPLYFTSNTLRRAFSQEMRQNARLELMPGIDLVLDTNKENWTRCAVLEAEDNGDLTKGGVVRGELRRGLSVDKNGRNQLDENCNIAEATMGGEQLIGSLASTLRPEEIAYFESIGIEQEDLGDYSFGMGWFPGYAIEVETGERLNIAFSENSWLGADNGADMLWNPTAVISEGIFNQSRIGGMHMIYVFRSNKDDGAIVESPSLLMPAYDEGQYLFDKLSDWNPEAPGAVTDFNNYRYENYMSVMRAVSWVGYPLLAPNSEIFGASGGNGVRIRLRASQPYKAYSPSTETIDADNVKEGETYYITDGRVIVNVEERVFQGDSIAINIVQKQLYRGDVFTAISDGVTSATNDASVVETINKGLPLYNFNTFDVAPTFSEQAGVDALDQIKAVPNPYYAYNEYESTRLEYLVKIINLPQTCTVNIFTVNGTLVRTFRKDDATVTSIDWDLKNQDNITVSSGLYIMHIEVPGIGEKVIKWFGVLRPIDLNSF